jgi:hypothetical protein
MTNKFIPILDCKLGYIYTLNSRNLNFGVFTSQNTFIGLRTKFDDTFLDHELHYDRGGTAMPLLEIEKLPSSIPVQISCGTYDRITKLEVAFDKPISDGGKGWYFIDTGLSSKNILPCRRDNRELFDYLQKINL